MSQQTLTRTDRKLPARPSTVQMRNSEWPSPEVLAGRAKSDCGAIAGALAGNYGSVNVPPACLVVHTCFQKLNKHRHFLHIPPSLPMVVYPHILDIHLEKGLTGGTQSQRFRPRFSHSTQQA